jgi:hypothetical protein
MRADFFELGMGEFSWTHYAVQEASGPVRFDTLNVIWLTFLDNQLAPIALQIC